MLDHIVCIIGLDSDIYALTMNHDRIEGMRSIWYTPVRMKLVASLRMMYVMNRRKLTAGRISY